MVGGQYYDGSADSARIAYATSLDGTWTIKDVWSGNESAVRCVAYADENWVVGGLAYDGSTYSAHVSYAINPDSFITE